MDQPTATVIAAVIMVTGTIIAAAITAVVANRNARAAMKSADAAMIGALKKDGGTPVSPATGTGGRSYSVLDWMRGPWRWVIGGIFVVILVVTATWVNILSLTPGALPRRDKTPPTSTVAAPDRDEIAVLLARARDYMSVGDVAAARIALRRAVDKGDSQAAFALGGTYYPIVLKRLGITNFHADSAQARQWYQRAAELGSREAVLRLDQLSKQ
jgi:hypothetical protein